MFLFVILVRDILINFPCKKVSQSVLFCVKDEEDFFFSMSEKVLVGGLDGMHTEIELRFLFRISALSIKKKGHMFSVHYWQING